jgi:hypothetical protein
MCGPVEYNRLEIDFLPGHLEVTSDFQDRALFSPWKPPTRRFALLSAPFSFCCLFVLPGGHRGIMVVRSTCK